MTLDRSKIVGHRSASLGMGQQLLIAQPNSAVELARESERNGDFAVAASHWSDVVAETDSSDALYWSYFTEWLFALRRANDRRRRAPLAFDKHYARNLITLSNFLKRDQGKSLDFERSALFKAIDLLMDIEDRDAVRALVNATRVLKSDRELVDKILGVLCEGASIATHAWIAETDFIADKAKLFKFVIQPFLTASEFDPLALALKELELEHALRGERISARALASRIEAVKERKWQTLDIGAGDAEEDRPYLVVPYISVEMMTALAVAIRTPGLLYKLHERFSADRLFGVLRHLSGLRPRYHVVTRLGFPMGGGESFMHQTCRVLSELGFDCIWTSFTDSAGKTNAERREARTPYYHDVRLAQPISDEGVSQAIAEGRGWIVHGQGIANDHLLRVADHVRCPILIGYHFWDGLVDLGSKGNYRIRQRSVEHSLSEASLQPAPRNVVRYVASEFMTQVLADLGGGSEFDVIHPVPDPSHYLVSRKTLGRTIVQVNIAPLKGGTILLECVKALGEKFPFVVVQTEPGAEEHDKLIREAIDAHPDCQYRTFGDVRQVYSEARLVLVPSLVDETFCRVAFEAAMNGIPVVSSRSGFLPLMLEDTGIYVSDEPAEWISTIERLYEDQQLLVEIGNKQREHLRQKFGYFSKEFVSTILGLVPRSLQCNVGLFGPWTNQGLGYQLRTYAKVIREAGLNAHVFSFQPYSATGKALISTDNLGDWAVPESADTVYFSFNNRENVPVNELMEFARANNIGSLIIPEICWEPNWARIKQLSLPGLFVHGVPNIETVRRAEVPEHNSLHSTMYNTKVCQQVLYALGVRNGRYIGHGYGEPITHDDIRAKQASVKAGALRFCHVGGHNPETRKQTPRVIEAFSRALAVRQDIFLTVTVMNGHSPSEWQLLHPNIKVVQDTLSHQDIIMLYRNSDVSIQVSSHEGLGLGFFESISAGTPVITLDVAPHNEIIIPGKCGWHVPAMPRQLEDNDDAVSFAATFEVDELANLLAGLDSKDIADMVGRTAETHRDMFDELHFLARFVPALSA